MNRDSLQFLAVGLVAGFLVGYVVQEQIAGVQPQRLAPGASPQAAAGAPPTAAPGRDPRMAEIERLRARLEQEPNDREALLTLANLNFDISNWPRAQELYERYLTLDPGNPDVLTDLGIALRSQGQFERALEQFRAARVKDTRHWQSRFNEAVVLAFDLKQLDAADAIVAELRGLAPGNADLDRLAGEIAKLRTAGG